MFAAAHSETHRHIPTYIHVHTYMIVVVSIVSRLAMQLLELECKLQHVACIYLSYAGK